MQYKKKHINDKIIEAGKEEYLEKGFRAGNISSIAASAGVPVGNLYRYFDGKSGLLDAIVKPATEEIPKIIIELGAIDEKNETPLSELMHILSVNLVNVFNEYGKEIIILADKCASTRYDNFTDDITKQVAMLVMYKLYPEPTESDRMMAQLIAKAFISSLFDILRSSLSNKDANKDFMQDIVLRILKFYFYDVDNRK